MLVGCGHAAAEPAQAPAPQVFVHVQNDVAPGPQRLDHVVTLGHDAYLPGARPVAPAGAQPGVVVNNVIVNQAPTWGYGYGYGAIGYGYRYSTPTYRSAPVNAVTGTPPVAGDWPKPPSYGPPLGAR